MASAHGVKSAMTNFIKSKVYTIKRKMINCLTHDYEYLIEEHNGYVFYCLDNETNELVKLGLYKIARKLYAIVDMQTGLQICHAHYRSGTKEQTVQVFQTWYKDDYLKMRHNYTLYTSYCGIFENAMRMYKVGENHET